MDRIATVGTDMVMVVESALEQAMALSPLAVSVSLVLRQRYKCIDFCQPALEVHIGSYQSIVDGSR